MMLLSACAFCAMIAAAPAPSPSPSANPEIAHVFTSDRTPTTFSNTARTIYVVTRSDIVRNGYRTVAEALSEIPALQISPYGPLGSNANFSLRGSTSAQVLVLVDGMPAPGSFSNTVELGNLPVTGVERIEVVEGGGSALYGAGAVGGVINIITQPSAAYGATIRAGSLAQRELDVETPVVQFSRVVAGNSFGLPDGGTRSNVAYDSTAFRLGLNHRIGSFDAILRAGAEEDHAGTPGPEDFLSPTSQEHDLNQDVDALLIRPTAQSETNVQMGASRQNILFFCSSTDPNCSAPMGDLGTEGRLNFGARNAVRGRNEQLLYGVDLSRGVVREDDGAGNITVRALAQTAAYAQERVDTHWGSYYAGVRAERDGALGGQVSPSAGAVVGVSRALSLRLNVANAFRAPNAGELYFPNYGNPRLRDERADVADITLGTTGDANVSAGWFGNRTNGLIYPDPMTFALTQAAHALIEGVVVTARTAPYHGFTTTISATDLYRAENLDAQTRLPNDPVIAVNARLDYRAATDGILDAFGAIITTRGQRHAAVASLPLFDQAIPYTNVGAYVRLRAGKTLLLTIRGYNLGNERYAAVQGYPLPGRSMLVELSSK